MKRLPQRRKLLPHHIFLVSGDLEGLQHNVRSVVTNRPGRKLDSVTHDVVLVRQNFQRVVALQRVQAPLRHAERIVRKLNLLRVLVPLVHRKIDDPTKRHVIGVHQPKLMRQVHPHLPQQRVHLPPIPRAEERRVPVLQPGLVAQLPTLLVAEKLHDRPPHLAVFQRDPRQPFRAFALRIRLRIVEKLPRLRRRALRRNHLHHAALVRRLLENLQLAIVKHVRHIHHFQLVTQIRLVRPVVVHRFFVRNPRKGLEQ